MEEKQLLAQKLRDISPVHALIGFDGFVDEIVHVVDIRTDSQTYSRIETMDGYAGRIQGGSGLSTNVELITVAQKLGGNGPIFANALKRQGMKITYIGSVGEDSTDPIFADLADGSRMIGLTAPAHTDAYEFLDGKIIVSKLQPFMGISWERILEKVGLDEFAALFDESALIGMENWTMLPHMSDIWKHVIDEVAPRMKTPPTEKTMFFDLADPEKRHKEDLSEALELIGRFTALGFRTVLGLNKKEACEIAELYGAEIPDFKNYPLPELMALLRDHIVARQVVIHPVDCACCAGPEGFEQVPGPYCTHPVLTTGAGDNFNAGFVTGVMNGFSPRECLLLGVYSSGFYVRNGHSPTTVQLADFLKD